MGDNKSDSRTAEKMIALMRFEMEDGRGCCSAEELPGILEEAADIVLKQFDGPEDLTRAQIGRIDRDVQILIDHVVMALVKAGHADKVEAMTDAIASTRRQCEAKFRMQTLVPLDDKEREALAKQWDERYARAQEAAQ